MILEPEKLTVTPLIRIVKARFAVSMKVGKKYIEKLAETGSRVKYI